VESWRPNHLYVLRVNVGSESTTCSETHNESDPFVECRLPVVENERSGLALPTVYEAPRCFIHLRQRQPNGRIDNSEPRVRTQDQTARSSSSMPVTDRREIASACPRKNRPNSGYRLSEESGAPLLSRSLVAKMQEAFSSREVVTRTGTRSG
jgi:hypothetical protein